MRAHPSLYQGSLTSSGYKVPDGLVAQPRGFIRAMLAQRLELPIVGNLQGELNVAARATPIAQFKHMFAPVANITTFDIDVKTPLIGNVAPVFTYVQKDTNASIGYSLSIISPQKVRLRCEQSDGCGRLFKEPNTWALKGDSQVFGFENINGTIPVALSATQSRAIITTGLNRAPNSLSIRNPNSDNRAPARGGADNELDATPGGNNQTFTSLEPIFISMHDISIEPDIDRFLIHQLFFSITRVFSSTKRKPYITLGGSIALNPDLTANTKGIILSQDIVWAFTGFNF